MYRLGVDVGGTHTDAVCVSVLGEELRFVAKHKSSTTPALVDGIVSSLTACIAAADLPEDAQYSSVTVGTTYFINNVVERSPRLGKVFVLRIGGSACASVPPFSDFPTDLKQLLRDGTVDVKGGFTIEGIPREGIDEAEVLSVIAKVDPNVGVVVSCPFGNVNNAHEVAVRDLIVGCGKGHRVTLSHEVSSSPDLLKRENAAIVNASLLAFAGEALADFDSAIKKIARLEHTKLFLTQNDGTVMSLSEALRFPIRTFGSGPTNSSRGAAYLLKTQYSAEDLHHGVVVVDVGGTTSDVTVLDAHLFPHQKLDNALLAGVRTNFRMPHVTSFGLGGGSIVCEIDNKQRIGPLSVGHRLKEESRCFGGEVTTLTDAAVYAGVLSIDGASRVEVNADAILAEAKRMIEAGIDDAKICDGDLPLILVGGGAAVFAKEEKFSGCSAVYLPDNFDVANAMGACISQVAVEVDTVVHIPEATDGSPEPETTVQTMRTVLETKLATLGATKPYRLVRQDTKAIQYIANNAMRVVLKIVADRGESEPEMDNTMPQFSSSTSSTTPPQCTPIPTEPTVHYANLQKNVENGLWVLCPADIECLSIGAGILGCGGGGSTYSSRLKVLHQLAEHPGSMKVAPLSSLNETASVTAIAFIGSPSALLETMGSGKEIDAPMRKVAEATGRNTTHIISAEIGGANCLEPLLQAAVSGVPYLDADGMGRAFPTVHQWIPFAEGDISFTHTSLGDERSCGTFPGGDKPAFDAFLGENLVKRGFLCGIAFPSMNKKQTQEFNVPNTVSLAWEIGRRILTARQAKIDPITSLGDSVTVLLRGKILDVLREKVGHIEKGTLKVREEDDTVAQVFFQNENLLVRRHDGAVAASTPDLICVLNSETGATIGTDEYSFGLKVTVVAMPAPTLLRSKKMLESVVPKAFGYDAEYTPLEG